MLGLATAYLLSSLNSIRILSGIKIRWDPLVHGVATSVQKEQTKEDESPKRTNERRHEQNKATHYRNKQQNRKVPWHLREFPAAYQEPPKR